MAHTLSDTDQFSDSDCREMKMTVLSRVAANRTTKVKVCSHIDVLVLFRLQFGRADLCSSRGFIGAPCRLLILGDGGAGCPASRSSARGDAPLLLRFGVRSRDR